MPDLSLFGDEHVRQYEATRGRVGHDRNGATCLILVRERRGHAEYQAKTERDIPVVLLRPH